MSDMNKNRPEDEFDFSSMSLNELLASIHADLGDLPPAEEAGTPAAPQAESAPAPVRAAVGVLARPDDPDEPTGELPAPSAKRAEGKKAKKGAGKEKRRLSRFWKGVIIFAAVFILLIAAALVVFWNYIAAFDRSLPETAVRNFIDAAGEAYWLDGVKSAAYLNVSEFEDEGAIVDKFLLSAIEGKEFSFRKYTAEYTDEVPVYIISAGSTDFCRVELSPVEGRSAGFGMKLWQVSKVELLESFLKLESRTVRLNVKEDSSVRLNGIEVGRDYVLPDSDSYVADYCIEGIYDDYTLEVLDAGGEPEEPVSVSGDSYFFPVPGKAEFTFNISAPSGAVVTVGGVTLAEDSIVSTGGAYPVFDSVEELLTLDILDDDVSDALTKALENQPTVTVYRYSVYDYEKPAVAAAFADGSTVEGTENADGGYTFMPHSGAEPDEEAAQRAEEFIRRYVNFSANIGNQAWVNLEALRPYLLQGSELYNRIVNAADAMTLVDNATVTYDYMELGDFISYGGILTTCRVSFGLINTTSYDTRQVDSCYDLALLYVNGAWRVVSMVTVE